MDVKFHATFVVKKICQTPGGRRENTIPKESVDVLISQFKPVSNFDWIRWTPKDPMAGNSAVQ
jgi:hypothetical protein